MENYLLGCLPKLGFDKNWINAVMRCIAAVIYAGGNQSLPLSSLHGGIILSFATEGDPR